MKWFNKNQVEDERIVHMKNKIYKEVYVLIMSICMVSTIVKSFMMEDWKSSLLELVIVVSGGLYFSVRSIFLGIYSDEVEVHDSRSKISLKTRNLLWSIGIVAFVALFIGIRNAILYSDGSWSKGLLNFFLISSVTLLMSAPIFVVGNLIIHKLANKASQKMSGKDLLDE